MPTLPGSASYKRAFAVQIAAVGGNQRGRTFFKQHGWTELGSDKIEQKVELHVVLCLSTLSKQRRNIRHRQYTYFDAAQHQP